MKSPKSSGKPRRRRPLFVRRIVGESMVPTLLPRQLLLATGFIRDLTESDLIVILHDNLEKVKRVRQVRADAVFVVGDNLAKSTDSREFGWLPRTVVVGKVIWPRYNKSK
jgi:Signal peptidase, peptidase S26